MCVRYVRRKDAKPYPPDTLYQIFCGLLRLLKEADQAEVNILTDPIFQPFRETLLLYSNLLSLIDYICMLI